MKVIQQEAYWYSRPSVGEAYERINDAGRTAYKSETSVKDSSDWFPFVDKLVKSGHLSVIEHESMSAILITDRGVSHEIVRHRLASFTQESTRYCNYSKDRFGNEITVIEPVWGVTPEWQAAMEASERAYFALLAKGQTAQQARSVLPNSLKTEIFMTANMREWRHVFQLRAIEKAAHPQMRALMIPLYRKARERYPEIFDLGEPE